MLIFRLLISYSVLFLASYYLLINLRGEEFGVGQVYLYTTFALMLFLYFLSVNYSVFHRLNKSFLILLLFIVYMSLNVLFDTHDITQLKNFTMGTTNGILFPLLLGIACSLSLVVIKNISVKQSLLVLCIGVLYLIFVSVFALDIFISRLEDVRSDLFLLIDTKGAYQRPSAFILMLFVLNCSLATVLLLTMGRKRYLFFLVILFVVIVQAVILMSMSQLIGSNSGFVTVVGFLFMWLVYVFILKGQHNYISRLSNIGFLGIIIGPIGYRILIWGMLVLMMLVLASFYLVVSSGLDLEQLRIFGFGSGEVNSVNSRVSLLKDNFVEHFSFNPVLGNTQVEYYTTGPGTYIHSTLSVFTHLGIIGGVIFLWFLFQLYNEMKSVYVVDYHEDLFDDKAYKLYRMFAIPCLLTFGLFSAFFTWMPLWFCFGLLGIRLVKPKLNNYE